MIMHRYTKEGSVSYYSQIVDEMNEEIDKISVLLDELYEERSQIKDNMNERIELTNRIRQLAIYGNNLIDEQTILLNQMKVMR